MIKRFIPERTPDELEQRLQELKRGGSNLRWQTSFRFMSNHKFIVGTVILVISVAFAGIVVIAHRSSNLLSNSLQLQAGFPLFAPDPLPQGLVYMPTAPKLSDGIVSFSLQSLNGVIAITEQATPQNPPDFTELPGFTSSRVPAGTAYIGSTAGRPVAIINSNTTLITVNGDPGVPNSVVAQLAQSLDSLSR